MFRLGRAMTACTAHVVSVLEDGTKQGVFDVPDPDLVANIFYTQALGVLNLATLRMSVRALDPGRPRVDPVLVRRRQGLRRPGRPRHGARSGARP